MNILITGAAGFLGRHLTRRLAAQGHRLWLVDNLTTTAADYVIDRDVIGQTWIHKDVVDLEDHPFAFDGRRVAIFDQIYHLACPASPPRYQANKRHTLRTAFEGTDRVLSLADEHNARIVIASTSEVYGEPLHHPQTERDWARINSLGPRACYDLGKAAAETMAMCYREQYGVDVRMARIFNTYGPGMDLDDGRVMSNLIAAALRGQSLPIYGTGKQTRSFCYVDDLIEGLQRMMLAETMPDPPVLNLGNPDECTILMLARQIADTVLPIVGSPRRPALAFKPLPGDDPTRRRPDISLARLCLEWEPTVTLAEGVARTAADFAHRIGATMEATA